MSGPALPLLALDTALEACQTAVLGEDGAVLASASEPMARGHQERLAPLVQAVMAEAGLPFAALNRIAVTVGPGSFTGLRVGLAFAKGLSVALRLPCVGVGTLEALAAGRAGFVVAAVAARGDQLYLQAFADGVALMAPDVLGVATAAARLAELWGGGPAQIVGPGAERLAGVLAGAVVDPRQAADIAALARLAAARPEPTARPRPLYLRAPDARTIAERRAAGSLA